MFLSEQEAIRCGILGDKTIQSVNKYPVYMKDLKSRILKFAHSKRGLYDKGYTEDNWY